MGGAADAGKSEAGGAEAAHPGRAGCLSEFSEGQSSRRDRVRGKARGRGRGDEPGPDAAFRRRMEVAIRCEEPSPIPLSRAAKAAGRPVDARGRFPARTRKTKSSCSEAITTPGMTRRELPTTASVLR